MEAKRILVENAQFMLVFAPTFVTCRFQPCANQLSQIFTTLRAASPNMLIERQFSLARASMS